MSPDFWKAFTISLWSALGALVFCLVLFGWYLEVSFPTLLMSIGLIPIGAAVVMGLIMLTVMAQDLEEP